jgi:sterol desaturase/sphingolipid hydroxylase (fatty acid hydroxylase superfamily)
MAVAMVGHAPLPHPQPCAAPAPVAARGAELDPQRGGVRHCDFRRRLRAAGAVPVAASIVVGLLLHDTYFYWTHRLLHSGWLFRRWHAEHHKSHNPSAWTAYSFSVPEAAVQGLFIPLYFFAVPVPHGAGVPFVAVALVINALGHCGIEFTPRVAVSHRWLGWLTGAVHHDIHHARSCSNYGLYFRFWDRLMGTEDPAFLAVYEFVRSPDNDGMGYRRFLGPRRREQPRDGVDGA